MNLEKKYISLIKEIILTEVDDAEIFIFGSRANNTNQEFSDVDIAIKSTKLDLQNSSLSFSTFAKIKFYLAESDLPYKVDVANYNKLDEKFLKNSIKL